MIIKRCSWVGTGKPHYEHYHDTEWGVAVHDDGILFEMLILEGAQAGLSWETILKRREGYRKAFKRFDVLKAARLTDSELEKILLNPDIIRNRLKVFSVRKNALVFLKIQKEFGSFDAYVWRFIGGKPKINRPKNPGDIPVCTPESDALSKDLKKRGMSFVGSTIIYAYMQAVGMVNDHRADCFKCPAAQKAKTSWTVYILECADKTLYTGITNDLKKRVAKHASGTGAKYTRGRAPYKILYTETHTTKSSALKREAVIKSLSKDQKLKLIAQS